VVTSNAGKKAEAFNTKYWAADTLIGVAEELKSDAAQSQAAYSQANTILDQIIAKGKEDANWMQPAGIDLQVKLLLARSMRGAGQFRESLGMFAEILQTNNSMLDVQMEAARTYQAWGEAANPGFFKLAMEGARPGPNRTNLIWGYGKIANAIANNPSYAEQFYEARYQLAVSRYKYAMGTPASKEALLKQAARDVESTAKLYPELGGPAMKKKFDALLKTIQNAQ
jgi:tetratricopeptide (TPR) repeat protein